MSRLPLLLSVLAVGLAVTVQLGAAGVLEARSTERELVRTLIERYKRVGKDGLPVANASERIVVELSLDLHQILSFNEERQSFRTKVWINQFWIDPLLTWNTEDFGNISIVRISRDEVWTPDIELQNSVDSRLEVRKDANIIVKNSGSIQWVPQALFESRCVSNTFHFPFDEQICTLEVGSSSYTLDRMEIQFHEKPNIGLADYVPNLEWKTDKELNIEIAKSDRCTATHVEDDAKYRLLRFKIRIYRNWRIYMISLVIPSMLLSTSTLVVFWIPPHHSAKVVLGVNILMGFVIQSSILAVTLPRAILRYPVLGYIIFGNLAAVTVSIVLNSIIIFINHYGRLHGVLPHRIRKLVIEGLGTLLLVRQCVPTPAASRMRLLQPDARPPKLRVSVPQLSSNKYQQPTDDDCDEAHEPEPGMLQQQQQLQGTSDDMESEDSPVMLTSYNALECDVKELKRFIRLYVNKKKSAKRDDLTAMEWRTFAIIVDRFFFLIYLIGLSLAFIICSVFYAQGELLAPMVELSPSEPCVG